ncbi:MAG: DUF945 family protein [Candidatus Binataceae bacterium]
MALVISASALAAAFAVLVVLPDAIGARAEYDYRSMIAQASSGAVRMSVDSYERGWFSSTAVVTVDLGGRQAVLNQEIYHGPFPLVGRNHSWLPVLAIVESKANLPLDLKSIIHLTTEGQPALTATGFLYPGGSATVNVVIAAFTGGNPVSGSRIQFDGGQCEWRLYREDINASGRFEHFHYSAGSSQLDASALSFQGNLHQDQSGLWIHDGIWRLRGLDFSLSSEPGTRMFPSHLAFQDMSVSSDDSISKGLLETDTRFVVRQITLPNGSTISSDLDWQLNNVDPHAVADWVRENQSAARSGLPVAQQVSELERRAMILLVRLAKTAPKATFRLELRGPSGLAASTLQAGVKPGLNVDGSDESDYQHLVRVLIDNYAYASSEIIVPATLFTEVVGADEQNGLLARGLIVREGSNFASRATYYRNQIFVNGQTLN